MLLRTRSFDCDADSSIETSGGSDNGSLPIFDFFISLDEKHLLSGCENLAT